MGCLLITQQFLSSILIQRRLFLKYKFNETKSVVGVEDLELWLRLFFDLKRKNIYFLEDPLVYIRRTPNSLNINYTQASLRNTYCILKFFLEKNIQSI